MLGGRCGLAGPLAPFSFSPSFLAPLQIKQVQQFTWQARGRIRLCGDSDRDGGLGALFKHLDFPVVDLLLFWQRQICLHGSLPIKKRELSPVMHKKLLIVRRFKLPGGHALFLDGEILRE